MNLPRPPLRLRAAGAAIGLAALLPLAAHAGDPAVPLRLEPGLHVFDTPQVFGPDSVLELVLTGQAGCDPCNTMLMFNHTVSFGGTLKLTMDDSFITWGGHQIQLFIFRGIAGTPGTALPTGRFETLDFPALDATQGWSTDSIYSNGTVLLAQLVPEPSAAALWAAGSALLLAVARRRARHGAAAEQPALRTRSG